MRKSIFLASTSVLSAPVILSGAYANDLTGLVSDLYAAVDVVSRELVGFIPSAARNSTAERAAIGQSVVYPIAPSVEAHDVVPAMQIPEPTDHAILNGQIQITKSRAIDFGFVGEEQRALNTSVGALTVQGGLIAQGLRTLVNEMEADLALEAALNASRAYGVAGTTPFAGDRLTDTAQVKKMLDDNGAPASERSLILDTTSGAALRSIPNLTRVNESGDMMTLRDGMLGDLHGLIVKESGQAVTHTPGNATGATTDTTGYAIGTTEITLAAAGTGAILKGDVITFAGDTSKYVVAQGLADISAGGVIKIAAPGLRVAIPAGATAISMIAEFASNVAFSSNALHLVTRAPALPSTGDAAIDRMTVVDPRSGLSFEFAIYAGYKKMMGEVSVAWGVKAVKPEHMVLLLG